MSVNAISPENGNEVAELFGPEALVLHRENLQRKLAELSIRVVEANKEYHECIESILKVNELLRGTNVNSYELASKLQAATNPLSAIKDYGRSE